MATDIRRNSAVFEGKLAVLHQIKAPFAYLYRQADCKSALDTTLLTGMEFNVYDVINGYGWGQAVHDDYIGFIKMDDLTTEITIPNYRVKTLWAQKYNSPDIKTIPEVLLPMNAGINGTLEGDFIRTPDDTYIPIQQLENVNSIATDWVKSAEVYLGAPYLWGGNTAAGIDCSGLIQEALRTAGISAPRDTYMQVHELGKEITSEQLQRGDLVFWRGHIGVMANKLTLLHANAGHMAVTHELLSDAITRIEKNGDGLPTKYRRVI